MRFHVVSLPHTHTLREYSSCAFTQKVIRFCDMMKNLGHEVFLYSGEKNEALCDEHIICVSEDIRKQMVGSSHFTEADWGNPLWQEYNNKVIQEMSKRISQKDFICLIGGYSQKPIADFFKNHISVEFGIGYSGVFADFKVFESYAWMHTIYGAQSNNNASGIDGKWYDVVIPNQFEEEPDYQLSTDERKYALYVGRIIDRKGYKIAQDVCQAKGIELILAGPGKVEGYGTHVGEVGPEERTKLMSGAIALFTPTQYIEPFGTVHVEAMACGTPIISTDWGVFTETIQNGFNGYRCRNFQEFYDALEKVKFLDHEKIREYANSRFSMNIVGKQYEEYFHRLSPLWQGGWYDLNK
jgi:glycosyltransferase involved in cell wall biosynthesis